MNTPKILLERANELETIVQAKYPKLAPLIKQCFLNTIETTVQQLEDDSYFVITGDIPAMWLRDSAAQLKPYIKYASQDEDLKAILKSVIAKHAYYINLDPYANAFNAKEKVNEHGYKDSTNFESKWVWERKYEIDSLCAALYLSHEYYQSTKDSSIFTSEFKKMIATIVATFKTEQHHESSPYFFTRVDCVETDTLVNNGKGRPVNYTGMTWSGFRPSDDACTFGYLIPSNMMAVVALKYAAELCTIGYSDQVLADTCTTLASEIDNGIQTYGIVDHYKYGKIFAYETDGFGNHNLMDDANSPSLLAIPYLGYTNASNPIYQNTRKFILSKDNPYYYEGTAAKGIGSPHTPNNYIWHISLTMQILTSTNPDEIADCLNMIATTHAGTNFMHEGFDVNNPHNFTREWFAWANTLFAQMVESVICK
ncbi:glycoside hydrolase family 125 protein [Paludicola sp. MB14-C6]|uniref:glycoside hydrolase family 125 protein n=1 Tax=Paludihabitans sp. MB14-C6 TaxID=3070656 RepID=UPI0027DBDAA7|nr:glycoside hydrolase family 125 protein [Paludicola sp. MB14-C6]WMJ22084.1 glycoside hydrolase family 125 protein [Paludicola sp. MB14-C6]